jgi:SAM domain (Sterile alpha motif)
VLELEQHADAFEREEVELDLVCSLSNADLLELGIADAGGATTVLMALQCNCLRNVTFVHTVCVFLCAGSRQKILAAAFQLAAPRPLMCPADMLPLRSVESSPRR